MPPIHGQLPSQMVAKEFGEVNVRQDGDTVHIVFTISMEPQGEAAEGWQTGVALDASASMYEAYGRCLVGQVPDDVMAQYERRGWIQRQVQDGQSYLIWRQEGSQDAIQRGYLRYSNNDVQQAAREFTAYLAGNLDADGGTTVVYWACGDGSQYEVVGDFTAEQCKTLELTGPQRITFGEGTRLKPVVQYFVDRFADAKRGIYLFLTDGRLDDLEEVKRYTKRLAQEIEAKKRNYVKCVLIGIGDEIDESQMEQLDDLDTGTSVDIWDHKIAKEMRSIVEIFAEVVDENQIVAPTARIYDSNGKLVKNFTDGLPTKVSFSMSARCPWFELEVGDERIRQAIAN